MKYVFALLALLIVQPVYAQNMVTNGSFEQYTTCPENLDEVHFCTGWQKGSVASSDYFNGCATGIITDVPQNKIGYQSASEGTAYAGIITYEDNNPDYAEYLIGTLQQLTPGHSYKVSLKISRADTCYFASNGIAAFFYVDNIGVNNQVTVQSLDLEPQIDFQNYSLVTDGQSWTTLTDTLVADSAYKHIVIGRFIDTSEIDTVRLSPGIIFDFAYYYIDEVSVLDLTPTNVSSVATIENIILSPNPFVHSTKLSFSNPQQKSHSFSIFNIEGRLVKKVENITKTEVLVERDNLDAGCYFYELKSEDGTVAKGKLFVQ